MIASLKNVLGLRTLGTFGPAIMALAFLATGVPLGLALLSVILVAVIVTRGALVSEKVQAAHRVAILVTTVAVSISSVAVLGLEFGQHELFFAVLFPVLITAWMGEKYVEQSTLIGWKAPTRDLVATIVVILVSFFVITQDWLIDFIMSNPLSWLVLVLTNWFLGTKVRIRLGEKFRFWGPIHYRGEDPGPGDFSDDLLTMIVRNREFVDKYNSSSLMGHLSKDKVKDLLLPLGVPMPKTHLKAGKREDLATFSLWLAGHDKFALKPATGYGGEGILLATGGGRYGEYDTNLGVLDAGEIEDHALSIIDGEFHDGREDVALVEELLTEDESLKSLAPYGLADFRVICFLGFPVMAMMRIPTRNSGGKANLHMGAVAAGVQISTGIITLSILRGAPKPYHPDTGRLVVGKRIPFWDEILEVAAEAQRLSGLGFAGVDVTLDAHHGPLVMEVNRRPGLEIQNANAAGLLRRLRAVESLPRRQRPFEERLKLVKQLDKNNWEAQRVNQTSKTVVEETQNAQSEGSHSEEKPPPVPVLSLPFDFYSGRGRAFRATLTVLILLVGSFGSLAASGTANVMPLLSPHLQSSEWGFIMTGVRELNAQGFSGKGITVCIVDTGIDPFHPDFAHAHIAAWWDLVNFRSYPYDDKGHGTAMAGLIAANGSLRGGAPGVQMTIIKALDSSGRGSPENVANGIHLCVFPGKDRPRADIISLSLGSSHQDNVTIGERLIYDAVTWAAVQGVVVVASAGNDGQADDGDVELPARVPLAIGVGAVDIDGHIAPFSSIGYDENQTAPDLKPELVAPGVRLVSTGIGARYLTVSGTSPAAAVAAATLALILEARPCLRSRGNSQNVLALKEALARGARKASAQILPHDPWYGYGIIYAPATLEYVSAACVGAGFQNLSLGPTLTIPAHRVR